MPTVAVQRGFETPPDSPRSVNSFQSVESNIPSDNEMARNHSAEKEEFDNLGTATDKISEKSGRDTGISKKGEPYVMDSSDTPSDSREGSVSSIRLEPKIGAPEPTTEGQAASEPVVVPASEPVGQAASLVIKEKEGIIQKIFKIFKKKSPAESDTKETGGATSPSLDETDTSLSVPITALIILAVFVAVQIGLSWKTLHSYKVGEKVVKECGTSAYIHETGNYRMFSKIVKRSNGFIRAMATMILVYMIGLGVFIGMRDGGDKKWKIGMPIVIGIVLAPFYLQIFAAKANVSMLTMQILSLVATMIISVAASFYFGFLLPGIFVATLSLLLILNLVTRKTSTKAADNYKRRVAAINTQLTSHPEFEKSKFIKDIMSVEQISYEDAELRLRSIRSWIPYLKANPTELRAQLEEVLGTNIAKEVYMWKVGTYGAWLDATYPNVETLAKALEEKKESITVAQLVKYDSVKAAMDPFLSSSISSTATIASAPLADGKTDRAPLYAAIADSLYRVLDRVRHEETTLERAFPDVENIPEPLLSKRFSLTTLNAKYATMKQLVANISSLQQPSKDLRAVIRNEKVLLSLASAMAVFVFGVAYYFLLKKGWALFGLLTVVAVAVAVFCYLYFSTVLFK